MSLVYGLCPKCMELKVLTKHHIFPKRYLSKRASPTYLHLCRECHNDLEYLISKRERGRQLKNHVYLNIAISFLKKE